MFSYGPPHMVEQKQLCDDTGCSPEDLPEAMNDSEEWREKVRDIRAGGTTRWWWWLWYIYIYIYIQISVCNVFFHLKISLPVFSRHDGRVIEIVLYIYIYIYIYICVCVCVCVCVDCVCVCWLCVRTRIYNVRFVNFAIFPKPHHFLITKKSILSASHWKHLLRLLQTGKTYPGGSSGYNDKLYLMLRVQFWRSEECGVPLLGRLLSVVVVLVRIIHTRTHIHHTSWYWGGPSSSIPTFLSFLLFHSLSLFAWYFSSLIYIYIYI